MPQTQTAIKLPHTLAALSDIVVAPQCSGPRQSTQLVQSMNAAHSSEKTKSEKVREKSDFFGTQEFCEDDMARYKPGPDFTQAVVLYLQGLQEQSKKCVEGVKAQLLAEKKDPTEAFKDQGPVIYSLKAAPLKPFERYLKRLVDYSLICNDNLIYIVALLERYLAVYMRKGVYLHDLNLHTHFLAAFLISAKMGDFYCNNKVIATFSGFPLDVVNEFEVSFILAISGPRFTFPHRHTHYQCTLNVLNMALNKGLIDECSYQEAFNNLEKPPRQQLPCNFDSFAWPVDLEIRLSARIEAALNLEAEIKVDKEIPAGLVVQREKAELITNNLFNFKELKDFFGSIIDLKVKTSAKLRIQRPSEPFKLLVHQWIEALIEKFFNQRLELRFKEYPETDLRERDIKKLKAIIKPSKEEHLEIEHYNILINSFKRFSGYLIDHSYASSRNLMGMCMLLSYYNQLEACNNSKMDSNTEKPLWLMQKKTIYFNLLASFLVATHLLDSYSMPHKYMATLLGVSEADIAAIQECFKKLLSRQSIFSQQSFDSWESAFLEMDKTKNTETLLRFSLFSPPPPSQASAQPSPVPMVF